MVVVLYKSGRRYVVMSYITSENLVSVLERGRRYMDDGMVGKATKGSIAVYVAPDGDDRVGDGSYERPYFTIQRAIDSLPDICESCVVKMKSGTYNYNNTNWGNTGYVCNIKNSKCGMIIIRADTWNIGDCVLNVYDNIEPNSHYDRGFLACYANAKVTINKLVVNYDGIDKTFDNTYRENSIIYCSEGKVEASYNVFNVKRSRTTVFLSGGGDILVSDGGTEVNYYKSSQKSTAARVMYGGIVSLCKITSKTGEEYSPPYGGNFAGYGGIIMTDKVWNATNTENLIGSYGGIISNRIQLKS